MGTQHGLAKLPYLRDSRRAWRGLDGFQLQYSDLSRRDSSESVDSGKYDDDGGGGGGGIAGFPTGRRFPDTVGIGNYPYADIHPLLPQGCQLDPYPNQDHLDSPLGPTEHMTSSSHATSSIDSSNGSRYMDGYPPYLQGENKEVLPYYLPFRALTSSDAGNLIVAGKCMAQSFLANAATRLHPTEWASGVAAGATAALMLRHAGEWKGSTREVLEHVDELQELLRSEAVGAPLEWTVPY